MKKLLLILLLSLLSLPVFGQIVTDDFELGNLNKWGTFQYGCQPNGSGAASTSGALSGSYSLLLHFVIPADTCPVHRDQDIGISLTLDPTQEAAITDLWIKGTVMSSTPPGSKNFNQKWIYGNPGGARSWSTIVGVVPDLVNDNMYFVNAIQDPAGSGTTSFYYYSPYPAVRVFWDVPTEVKVHYHLNTAANFDGIFELYINKVHYSPTDAGGNPLDDHAVRFRAAGDTGGFFYTELGQQADRDNNIAVDATRRWDNITFSTTDPDLATPPSHAFKGAGGGMKGVTVK